VGRLEGAKGVGRTLQILARLHQANLPVVLDLVGDGPERSEFENMAKMLGIQHLVTFHGWLPRPALAPIYSQAHLMLFPTSSSEGWPKVLSEGMAYGVVPLSTNVSSIPQYLAQWQIGRTFTPDDLDGFTQAILWYAAHPNRWREEARRGTMKVEQFTYSNYLSNVRRLLGLPETPRIECA
jgi:glycosyltransferase involved in cell wall biosynthesis